MAHVPASSTSPAGPGSASTPDDVPRAQLGELLAPMTEVAAANPYAWFPRRAHGRASSSRRRPTNRMVGYPYTKYMVSIMDVDMAGRRDRGQPRRRPTRSACRRSAGCTCAAGATPPTPSTSPSTPTCGARRPWPRPSREALRRAGVGIDDVAHLDLYSCFASVGALRAATRSGIDADDAARRSPSPAACRSPAAPGSNYMTALHRHDGRRAARRPRRRSAW